LWSPHHSLHHLLHPSWHPFRIIQIRWKSIISAYISHISSMIKCVKSTEHRIKKWLVVWKKNIFPIILGMSSSQLTFIFFRGVGSNHQPEKWWRMDSKWSWMIYPPVN
jgi:hypothetical protein